MVNSTQTNCCYVTCKQVGRGPPFGGLSPVWWLDARMVCLFYLPNGTHFSFITPDDDFLMKGRIVFATGAGALTCFLHNNTFV